MTTTNNTNITVSQEVLEKLLPAMNPFMALVDEQNPHFNGETPIEEIATALSKVATMSEINHLLRMVQPNAPVSGKGVTAISKCTAIMKYLHAAYVMTDLTAMVEEPTTEQPANGENPTAEQQQPKGDVVMFTKEQMEAVQKQHKEQMDALLKQMDELTANFAAAQSAPTQEANTTNSEGGEKEMTEEEKKKAALKEAVARINGHYNATIVNEETPRETLAYFYKQLPKADPTDAAIEEELTAEQKTILENLKKNAPNMVESMKKSFLNANKIQRNVYGTLDRTADAIDKYGHSTVDSIADLLFNGFDFVGTTGKNLTQQVVRPAGHVVVDAASNTVRATRDVIGQGSEE